MAELVYRVATDWKEVERLYNEIMKLNAALEKSNTDSPRAEISSLISKLDELKSKYAEIIQTTQQANEKLSVVFKDSSSENPYKGLEDNAEKASKTLNKSFDDVISKVCELYDYIKETKDLIGSLTETSDVITKITDCISELSNETKRQELNLSNQAAQNTNILQQQQAGVMSMTQQNVQAQSLNEAASERAAIEEEVKGSIDDTTATIKKQTTAVNENTEAIKNQKEEMGAEPPKIPSYTDTIKREIEEKTKELQETVKKSLTLPQGSLEWEGAQTQISNLNKEIDELTIKLKEVQGDSNLEELKEDALSIESTIGDLKEGIKGLSENDPAAIQANEIIREKELLLEGLRNKIVELEEKEESLKQKNEELGESGEKFANYLTFTDEIGKSFIVWGDNAQDARMRAEQAQEVMDKYPEILQQIKEKAKDMYMTSEGDKLVKEAEEIGAKLSEVKSTADMFDRSGAEVGSLRYERLLNILERLGEIDEEEKNIIEEQKKQAELARIQEQEAEQRALHSQTMRTRIMKAREEMIQLIEAGKKGTPEFMELAEKAGDMRKEMQLANAYMSYFDDPNRGLTTLKVGLQGVAGAASLVTSTIGLFNEDSKKMIEIQTKVQSILGIVVGLETTYNLVKRTSVFMIALEEVKTWALAKARGVQAAATTAATAAQEGLNAAMSKTPWGAIVAILVTLGTAIFAVTKALTSETEAEKKAREEKEAHIKAIKEQQEKWAQSVAESASKQIMSYKELQKKWNELGNDMAKKKKFVKDNQTAFHNLGMSVNGVTDAENLLVKNTDAVVDSMMARAKALAYQELMTDSYKKQIEEQMKADQKNASVEGGQYSYRVKAGGNATDKRNKAYQNARAAGYTFMEGDTKDGKWTEQGARRLNQYNSNYAAQQRVKAAEEDKKRNKKYDDEQKKLLKKTEEELEKEKKRLANAGIKTYDPMTDKKDKEKKDNGKTAAEKAQEQRELMDKQKREQIRAAEDLEFSTREARIKAMEESSAKVLAQIELNHDKEVKAIERAYEDMRIKRVEAAKQLWEKDEKNKGKNFFDSDEYKNALYNSETETENYNERLIAARAKRNFALREREKEELRNMRDFLKEYGSFEEKRLAITQEYEQKINEETDPAKKASLSMKLDEELSKIGTEEMRQKINWDAIFQDVLNYDVKFLNDLQTQLEAAIKDGIEKGIGAADLKVFADKLQEVKDAIVSKSGGIFGADGILGGSWMGNIKNAQVEQRQRETIARNKRKEADRLEGEAQKADLDRFNAQFDYQKAVEKFGEESKEAKDALSLFKVAAGKSEKAQIAAANAAGGAAAAEGAVASGAKRTAMSLAITDAIIHGVNQNLQSASKMVKEWGIGSKDFQEKFAKFAESSQYATAAFDSLKNGDIAGVVYNLGNAFNTLGESFGVWSNSNRAEVEKENEKLAVAMSVNTEAVNRLTDAMKKATPAEAFKYYEQAVSALELNEQSARQKMENNAYMYDGGHSLNYDLDDANGTIRAIFNLLGKKPNGDYDLGGLLRTLSAKEWNELYKTDEGRKLLQQLGQAIAGAEDDGNYNGMFQDILDYINSYNEDAYQELANQFNETVTNISFDSMYSSFVSSLMDMDKKAQDFTQDFEGYMRNAIYQSLVAEQIKPLLEDWYGAFAYYMSDGELSPDEIKALKSGGGTYGEGETKEFKSLNSIEQTGLKIRDGIEQLGLYNGKNGYNQTATGKSLENMSYTQADSLVGIATAQQIAQEQSRDRLDMLNVKADQVYMVAIESRDIAADSRQILAGMAIHVEEIRDGMVDTLVPAIKDMRSDLAKVRKLVEEQ